MSYMIRYANNRRSNRVPQPVDPAKRGGADKNDPYERNFTPLILPGLVSVPELPAWLRRPFRRGETHTER